jgi:hypothetical protein
MGGKIVRTIGIARARLKIGMMNLGYNIRRLVQMQKLTPSKFHGVPLATPDGATRPRAAPRWQLCNHVTNLAECSKRGWRPLPQWHVIGPRVRAQDRPVVAHPALTSSDRRR